MVVTKWRQLALGGVLLAVGLTTAWWHTVVVGVPLIQNRIADAKELRRALESTPNAKQLLVPRESYPSIRIKSCRTVLPGFVRCRYAIQYTPGGGPLYSDLFLWYGADAVRVRHSLEGRSSARGSQGEGELTIYDMSTEIGVVAMRVFRDASGRVAKTIYYSSTSRELKGPYSEDSLRVRSSVVSEYDENGVLRREKHYGPKMNLRRIMDLVCTNAEKRMIIWRRPDETREYEIKYQGKRELSHLYFDITGKNLVGMNGEIPSDIELASGWGQPVGGIACGLGVNRIRGTLRDIQFSVTVRNLTASPCKVITCLPYHQMQVELRNEVGQLVPQNADYIRQRDQELIRMNHGINEATQTISPHQARQFDGGHELQEWYSNVQPGKYFLTVRRRADGPDFTLASKPVKLQIVQ